MEESLMMKSFNTGGKTSIDPRRKWTLTDKSWIQHDCIMAEKRKKKKSRMK